MNESEDDQRNRTFISFVNHFIAISNRKIESLEELYTGVDFYYLLKSLCDKEQKIFPIFSTLKIKNSDVLESVAVRNIQNCFDWLSDTEGFPIKKKIPYISSTKIFNKNIDVIIGFLWSIIIYFHFYGGGMKSQIHEEEIAIDYNSYYLDVLDWANNVLSESTSRNKVRELSDWSDGKRFYVLLTTLFTENPDHEFFKLSEKIENGEIKSAELIEASLDFAEENMIIPKIITKEEFLEPEELSLAIYFQFIRLFDELNNGIEVSDISSVSGIESEKIFDLRKNMTEQKNEFEQKIEELKEHLNEKEETIRSLTSTPTKTKVLDRSIVMDKLKQEFFQKEDGIVGKYKDRLKKAMVDQYKRGKRESIEDIKNLKSKLEDSEKKMRKMEIKISEFEKQSKKLFAVSDGKKKEGEGENKECCIIL